MEEQIRLSDADSEEAIIGILLIDEKKQPMIIGQLEPEDFFEPNNRTIYKAIKELNKIKCDIDIVTVSNKLNNEGLLDSVGGREYINDLAINVITTVNYKSYIKVLTNLSKKRKILSLLESYRNRIESTDEVDEIALNISKETSDIVNGKQDTTTSSHIANSALEVFSDIEYIFNNKTTLGTPTPFKQFNKITGGLQSSKLYILGGRPSMGKSALAMNIAEHISKTKPVLFVSLEMGEKEYAQRIMFAGADTNQDMINQGIIDEDTIARITKQIGYLSELKLFIHDKSPCRLQDIELAMLNIISSQGELGLVVVDYIQLLTPTTKGRAREQEIAEISRGLKELAMKYKVPIVALSQLSRALEAREDKRPMMSDLRESGAIEQDADFIMFTYRDEYYHPEEIASRGKAELIIRKNRGGRLGNIPMSFNSSKCEFKEINYESTTSYTK